MEDGRSEKTNKEITRHADYITRTEFPRENRQLFSSEADCFFSRSFLLPVPSFVIVARFTLATLARFRGPTCPHHAARFHLFERGQSVF
jgi:hypothetical protein